MYKVYHTRRRLMELKAQEQEDELLRAKYNVIAAEGKLLREQLAEV